MGQPLSLNKKLELRQQKHYIASPGTKELHQLNANTAPTINHCKDGASTR